jgi:hypothetical protein
MVKCSNGKENCRSFKIVGSGISFVGGRYVAETQSVAAKRAGSRLFQKIENDPSFKEFKSRKSIKFIIRETTQGSLKKTTAYEVFRETLPKPIVTTIKGVEIIYKYNYTVTKLKLPDIKGFDMQKAIDLIK